MRALTRGRREVPGLPLVFVQALILFMVRIRAVDWVIPPALSDPGSAAHAQGLDGWAGSRVSDGDGEDEGNGRRRRKRGQGGAGGGGGEEADADGPEIMVGVLTHVKRKTT